MASSASRPLLTLVTGSTAGIGYYTSYHLAQRGHHVLFGCRTLDKGRAAIDKLKEELPDVNADRLEPFVVDITDDASVANAVQTLESQHGYLDILVNNAGISSSSNKGASARELWTSVLSTNVTSTYLLTEALLPLLCKSTAPAPGRRVVFVSSGLGSIQWTIEAKAFQPSYTPYSSSKAALNLFTNYYVHQLRDNEIAVVSGSPGFCATNLNGFSGFKAPKQGALELVESTIIKGDFDSVHGKYFEDGGEIPW